MQYKFHLNNLRIAPRKVRQVIALIKGSPVEEAETQLKFQSKRAALPILKLLKSGAASAINNFNLSPDNLYIANIFVDEGQTLKRFRPRAFGKAGAIHKKTSHVTLVLEERAAVGVKKTKKKIAVAGREEAPKKEVVIAVPKKEAPKEIKPKGKFEGITRRIFRRKAIG
jgi:large subunit ribosomal protein L22